MKKKLKILFTVLFAFLLSFTASAVFAFASDEAGTESDTIPEGAIAKYTYLNSDSSIAEEGYITTISDLRTKGNGTTSYTTVVTLISDVELSVAVNQAFAPKAGAVVYLDLAGHTLYSIRSTASTWYFVKCGAGAEFNLYSSERGGKIIHTRPASNFKGDAAFYVSAANTNINIGDIQDPISGKIHSGNNLLVSASKIFDCVSASTGSVVNVIGGTYLQNGGTDGSGKLINLRGPAELNIENATLASTASTGSMITVAEAATGGKLSAKNSVFCLNVSASTRYVFTSGIFGLTTLDFEGCYFLGQAFAGGVSAVVGTEDDPIVFDNCYFANSELSTSSNFTVGLNSAFKNCRIGNNISYVAGNGFCSVKTDEAKAIEFEYNTLTWDSTNGRLDNAASSAVATYKQYVSFDTAITISDIVEVTWKHGAESVTEKWLKGVIPTPSSKIILPEETDTYRYAFTDVCEAQENVTYEAKAIFKLGISANLSLYSDFYYNVYIPTYYVDEGYVTGNVYLPGHSTPITLSEKTVIGGEEYYFVSFPVAVLNSLDSFSFVMEFYGADNSVFEQEFSLSVIDYCVRVLDGGYNADIKSFIKSIIAYVDSVYSYANVADELLASVVEQYGITNAESYGGVQQDTAPESISAIFDSVQLNLGGKIEFRFVVAESAVMPEGISKIRISYYKDGIKTSSELSLDSDEHWSTDASGNRYFSVTMRAKDLVNKGITVKVGSDSWSYSLSNYIYALKNDEALSANTQLTTLLDNMWGYAVKSMAYSYEDAAVGITIADNAISDYTIVYTEKTEAVAEMLQTAIAEKLGVSLAMSAKDSFEGDKAIYIELLDITALDYENDFTAKVGDDGNLYINCNFASFVNEAVDTFIADVIFSLEKEVNLEGTVATYNTDKFYYSDFGAVGDGELVENKIDVNNLAFTGAQGTDDFSAIYYAHEFANAVKRHTVYAEAGKTYYLQNSKVDGSVRSIKIKTNTVWTGAAFIIDDETLTKTQITVDGVTISGSQFYQKPIFEVANDYNVFTLTNSAVTGITVTDNDIEKIALNLGYPAMLVVKNENHRNYIRYGSVIDSGKIQEELILVDAEGNIDKSTPFMFDYTGVTSIDVYRTDITPISVIGGDFITIAPRADRESGTSYFYRGIVVSRSYTTLDGLSHVIYGEFTEEEAETYGLQTPVYTGFYRTENCTDATLKNCEMSARRYFGGGTYGLSMDMCNNVTVKDCEQTNFYIDYDADGAIDDVSYFTNSWTPYWGLSGSGHCKNVTFDKSSVTRIDAHTGIYNLNIKNSHVAYIFFVGKGEVVIENTVVENNSNYIFNLRNDYGSTFDGTVTIKDCIMKMNDTSKAAYIMNYGWSNHYFGYECAFPNIIIDNLNIVDGNGIELNKTITLMQTVTDTKFENVMQNGSGGLYQTNISESANIGENRFWYSDGNEDVSAEYDYRINYNPTKAPEYIIVRNSRAGITYNLLENYAFFGNTEFSVNGMDTPVENIK